MHGSEPMREGWQSAPRAHYAMLCPFRIQDKGRRGSCVAGRWSAHSLCEGDAALRAVFQGIPWTCVAEERWRVPLVAWRGRRTLLRPCRLLLLCWHNCCTQSLPASVPCKARYSVGNDGGHRAPTVLHAGVMRFVAARTESRINIPVGSANLTRAL